MDRLRVCALPDMHFPFSDSSDLKILYSLVKEMKPDIVIQMGDMLDCFSTSKFSRSYNVMTPKQEFKEGREMAVNMWKNIQSAAPKAQCIGLVGNHDMRPVKRIIERLPELEGMFSLKDVYDFKNVKMLLDDKAWIEIDGILYMHGFLTKLGDHAKYFNRSVVHGHTHKGGVIYINRHDTYIFELDCGFMADIKQVPMQYGATKHNHWIKGCGVIDHLGPRFIAL